MPTLLQVATNADGGGLERLVRQLGDAAVERGWRTIVAHWRRDPPAGARAEYVRLPPRVWGWPPALWRLVRRLRPDVVHLHGPAAGSLGAVAVRSARIRSVVFTDHSVASWRPRRYGVARRLTSRLPARNVAVSAAVARSMAVDGWVPRSRLAVIPNGTAEAPPLPPPGPGRPPLLVCVANLSPWKGHRTLVRAFSGLPEPLGATLVCVGDGPERAGVEAEARRLGVGDRVRITGFLEDPWSVAAGAWAFVLASSHEGAPLAVMEAMMRGLPVVATAVGGVPGMVVPGRTGWLVPPEEPAALAAALEEVLADRERRDEMGAAARETARERFGLRATLDAYLALYEELLGA